MNLKKKLLKLRGFFFVFLLRASWLYEIIKYFDNVFCLKYNRKTMKISIDDIKNAKDQSLKINLDNKIKDLSTEGNISAELVFKAYGKFINAKGKIVANVKLVCDRCLKDFTKKFEVDVDETYMLGQLIPSEDAHSGQEIELKDGDFVTELTNTDEIDIDDLIYQSVTLNIPNPCVCDINCVGDPEMEKYMKKEISDPRLEVFKNLKIKKEGK